MNKKILAMLLILVLAMVGIAGCSQTEVVEDGDVKQAQETEKEDVSTELTAWPERPVTIVVPFGAGGDSDFNARALAERLTELSGKNFVVTNIEGNSGATGSLNALNSDPDGYTILFNHTAFSVNYFAGNSTLTYDDAEVCAICAYNDAIIFVAKPDQGYTTISELIDYSKTHSPQLVCAASAGTTALLPALKLSQMGADINIVDEGGTANRLAQVLGGHVDFTSLPYASARDYIETGELVEIENDMDMVVGVPLYYQMLFPKGTDQEIISKLSSMLEEIVTTDKDYADTILKAYEQYPYYKDTAESIEIIEEYWKEFETYDWEGGQ